jgi:hypothetical protein
MDAELYSESVVYEKLTQAVHQAMLEQEGVQAVAVEHNLNIAGRSGVEHQIDVSWRFKQATISHHVLVECKNYTSAITLEKVRNFFAVLHDIGNCQGIMVTKTGFQSGVVEFAKYYGIGLKLLGEPTEEDWEGKVRNIKATIQAIALSTQPGREPVVQTFLDGGTQEEVDQLNKDLRAGKYVIPSGPEMFFVDAKGIPITPELRWWLPKMLSSEGNGEGGPYEKTIELQDHYILPTALDGSTRCIKVKGLKVVYYYDIIDTREFTTAGDEIVRAILKDFGTGEIEHVLHHDDGGQSSAPTITP